MSSLAQAISPSAFERVQAVFQRESGIRLSASKKSLVSSRLNSRLQSLGLSDFDSYCALISDAQASHERRLMVDLLTTNETYFFREPVHFEHLVRDALPSLANVSDAPLRVWCAASSSGEEAFSVAMSLAEAADGRPWEVVGTDLSERVLAIARRGLYGTARLQHMPAAMLKRYCLRGTDEYSGKLLVAREIRDKVRFQQHNLLHAPRTLGSFDVIFLRNVLIYFDRAARRQILENVLQTLRPGGWLYTGHTDSLHGFNLPLRAVRPSIFRNEVSA